MITKIFKYIRAGLILGLIMSVALLAVEVYFVVTNSNALIFGRMMETPRIRICPAAYLAHMLMMIIRIMRK